jgi:hypothetical protein
VARGGFRYVPNPSVYRSIARSGAMRDLLKDRADHGADIARAIAPSYSGPTWDPQVQRSGEYQSSVFSAASLTPSGWRGQFGADAAWTLQVEFGSGRPATSRERPQHGHSPKTRTLGRALDAMRST